LPESLRALGPVAAVFALLIGLMTWGFDAFLTHRNNPNLGMATGPEAPQRVVLERNPAGRYLAPGTINGRQVTFLVDTGADHVAVPAGVAQDVGLERGQPIRIGTAGGAAVAYTTRIDRITLGGIRLRDVRGSITPTMGGDAVLLGMTFLRHVDFSKRGERLIIEPATR